MGTRHGLALCCRSRALRGRFFDFQDIGPLGDLEQVIKELKVFRPFPGPSGEFHKRRLLAIADNGRHPKDVVRLARLFVIGPHFFFIRACAQILRQYGGVYIDFPGYSQQLQRIGDIAFVHVIGAKDGHVVALERCGAVRGQDALHRLMRGNVPTGKARVFPGFPPQFTPTVHLFQQKGFPGDVETLTQLLLDTPEPLRGSPGVGSHIAVPDGQIIGLSHTQLLLG